MLLARSLRAVSPLIRGGSPAARSLSAAAAPRRLDLSGIYPPIATPFTAAEDVDHGKLAENLKKYAEIPFRGQASPTKNVRTQEHQTFRSNCFRCEKLSGFLSVGIFGD